MKAHQLSHEWVAAFGPEEKAEGFTTVKDLPLLFEVYE